MIGKLQTLMNMQVNAALQNTRLTGGNFEERSCEPSPHVGDSLGEIVGESPLFKRGQSVCDYMSDLSQVSKVSAHFHQRADLK